MLGLAQLSRDHQLLHRRMLPLWMPNGKISTMLTITESEISFQVKFAAFKLLTHDPKRVLTMVTFLALSMCHSPRSLTPRPKFWSHLKKSSRLLLMLKLICKSPACSRVVEESWPVHLWCSQDRCMLVWTTECTMAHSLNSRKDLWMTSRPAWKIKNGSEATRPQAPTGRRSNLCQSHLSSQFTLTCSTGTSCVARLILLSVKSGKTSKQTLKCRRKAKRTEYSIVRWRLRTNTKNLRVEQNRAKRFENPSLRLSFDHSCFSVCILLLI